MPLHDDRSALRDIELACALIAEFVAECSLETFCEDARTYSATQLQLATVGEAVKRLSTAFREANP